MSPLRKIIFSHECTNLAIGNYIKLIISVIELEIIREFVALYFLILFGVDSTIDIVPVAVKFNVLSIVPGLIPLSHR